jgi:hypothetical protein
MEAKMTKKISTQAKYCRKTTVEGNSKGKPNLKRAAKTLPKATIRVNSSGKQVHSQTRLSKTQLQASKSPQKGKKVGFRIASNSKFRFPMSVWQELSGQLKQYYFDVNVMLQVAIFIAGVWLHHFMINALFGKEQPSVLTTMIPGLEWIMAGLIIHKTLSYYSR